MILPLRCDELEDEELAWGLTEATLLLVLVSSDPLVGSEEEDEDAGGSEPDWCF